jgi:drug/metabolite transporter (DMT)-like permease
MWSFSFIIVDIGIEYITPLTLALYRFIIASLAFIVIDFFRIFKNRKSNESPSKKSDGTVSLKKTILLLLFASLSGVSLFFLSQYLAIQLIGPSLPALFVCLLAPIIISILALFFFN